MCLLRVLFRSDRCHRCPVAPGLCPVAAASALGLSSVARRVGQYMECIGVSALTVHTTLALQSSAFASLASRSALSLPMSPACAGTLYKHMGEGCKHPWSAIACSSGVCLCCCIFIGLCIILAIWYRLHALSDAICVPTPSLSAYSIGASSARLIVLVMPWPAGLAGSSRTHSSSWLPPCVWPAGRYIPDPMRLFVGWCTGWPGLLLCAAGALPSVHTRCFQFMRNALVFGNVWHAWAVASGTQSCWEWPCNPSCRGV
jgi:hypothetical protein